MNVETYLEWMRRQGHQVYQTKSSSWYDAGPRVLQAFPYHWLIQPSKQELNELMSKIGAVALRYSTPINASNGMVSYHVILNNPYNLDMLRSQARNGVKKGLSRFCVERISFERLADEGWKLQHDTLDRQDRLGSMTQAEWQRICLAACDLRGFEAWAATANGTLAAALITARVGDRFYVPYAMSFRDYLRDHVNNALFYTVCCDFLARDGIAGIFFCLHSLDAPESVDEFKFRMSFIARPVRQCVTFHPWLQPFVNKTSHALIERLSHRYPDSHILAKAEGMMRFHLLGKQPIDEQQWPECIAQHRTVKAPSTYKPEKADVQLES